MKTLSGLYAITSESVCATPDLLIAAVKKALAGGAHLLQYRDKWNGRTVRERNAQALLVLCRQQQVALIINDDVELAASIGADGVHLGSTDAPQAHARAALGKNAIIGVSCANSLERAETAATGGASYVAFGRFFASLTKPEAPPALPELITQARRKISIPICAIGGITPENAVPLIAAGADMVAAVEGVFGASNIRRSAAAYAALFHEAAV